MESTPYLLKYAIRAAFKLSPKFLLKGLGHAILGNFV